MTVIAIEIGVLLLLVLANGLFSMSELAVLSARKARLKVQAQRGLRGAERAVRLQEDPNRFLPTVQIGITLVGTFAGAFGGITLAEALDAWLETRFPALGPYSEVIAMTVVVVAITYVTLVLGELVPKRMALAHPEWIARHVAGLLDLLSRVTVPVVRILGYSTEGVMRLLGVRASSEPPVTEEDVEAVVRQAAESGVFKPSQHEIVRRVFRLGDRRAGELMTPRNAVVWIDLDDPPAEIRRKIAASPHSRFPVCEGSLDLVVGIVQVKDLLVQSFRGAPFNLRGITMMPLFLYEGTPAFRVLELFKSSGIHIGLVLDEYGSVEGIITMNDLLEALVGDLPAEGDTDEPPIVEREDGTWLVDGRTSLDDVADRLNLPRFPDGDYHTLAGFLIDRMGRIPRASDRLTWAGRVYEVVDMDHHRVDKILIMPEPTDPP
jgi:putative hemolysin